MPSRDWEQLTNNLGRLFERLTPNSVVIWDRPDARRPNEPYVTLNYVTGPTRLGQLDEQVVEDDGSITVCANRQFTLGIKAYIGDARAKQHNQFWRPFQVLEDLSLRLTSPGVRELFRAEGLAIMNVTGVIDITELLETGFEPRASFDVLIAYNETYNDTAVGTGIEKVEVTHEGITDNTGTTDETFIIEDN